MGSLTIDKADLVIEIRGGIAELVKAPDGLKVIQRDYDTEGANTHDLVRDEQAEPCFHKDWVTGGGDINDPLPVLGERNYTLLAQGARVCGPNADEVYGYVWENLYTGEAETIKQFLQWCERNDSWFGHGNYEQRFAQFKEATREKGQQEGTD